MSVVNANDYLPAETAKGNLDGFVIQAAQNVQSTTQSLRAARAKLRIVQARKAANASDKQKVTFYAQMEVQALSGVEQAEIEAESAQMTLEDTVAARDADFPPSDKTAE
jgi:hypothetical protein